MQKQALSAGYYFKCPLCNNGKKFRNAMKCFGIYVPDQDASWELEPNAFQELLHQHNTCDAHNCVCPVGRFHVKVGTRWELVLCRYCHAQYMHVQCDMWKRSNTERYCDNCKLMLQRAQAGASDRNNDEVPQPSISTAIQTPARRKRPYSKGSGGSQSTKYREHSVCSLSAHPHPPHSSQSTVMSKGGPSALRDGPIYSSIAHCSD